MQDGETFEAAVNGLLKILKSTLFFLSKNIIATVKNGGGGIMVSSLRTWKTDC